MKFGALFLTDPPVERFIELAQMAEEAGFDYVWTSDSQILWYEPWPLMALALKATSRVKIGPLVTNPGTRDWTVVASLMATLNDISGGRAVCGIGRGDSARRTIGLKPVSVAEFEQSVTFIKRLAEGKQADYHGKAVQLSWAQGHPVTMWGAAYGPKTLQAVGRTCNGFVLQLADPDVFTWTTKYVREGAQRAGRDPGEVQAMVAAPPYVSADREHAHAELRWFAGSVANHVEDLVSNYAGDDVPTVLTDYIRDRPSYDYTLHGRSKNPRTEYVPDEINERFCVMGEPDEHVAKLRQLRDLGADIFTGYFIHDNIEGTLQAYGEHVIPALRNGGGRS